MANEQLRERLARYIDQYKDCLLYTSELQLVRLALSSFVFVVLSTLTQNSLVRPSYQIILFYLLNILISI